MQQLIKEMFVYTLFSYFFRLYSKTLDQIMFIIHSEILNIVVWMNCLCCICAWISSEQAPKCLS